jgi:hypothetical protein
MKNLNTYKAALAVLALGTLVGTMTAAAADRSMARFDIPFQFVVGNEVLPAGHYEVVLVPDARVAVREVSEAKTHIVGLTRNFQSRSSVNSEKSLLRFSKYGDTLFLSAVWGAGDVDARTVAPGKPMIEASKADAGASAEVTIGASLR